jgi:uncharacterized glyoxalase superfamily protein PhnB
MADVKSIPEGFHTLTPHITVKDAAQALDFYKAAFGAEEMVRMPGPGGKVMHAEIRIGDSRMLLNEEFLEMDLKGPKEFGGSPVTLHLYVEDADALVKQAANAGAKITMPVQDTFWGDRYGRVEDPFGHQWAIATRVREMSFQEMRDASRKALDS